MHTSNTDQNKLVKTVEELLNWHSWAVLEALMASETTGKSPKVVVTQELVDRHKKAALEAINEQALTTALELIKKQSCSVCNPKKNTYGVTSGICHCKIENQFGDKLKKAFTQHYREEE